MCVDGLFDVRDGIWILGDDRTESEIVKISRGQSLLLHELIHLEHKVSCLNTCKRVADSTQKTRDQPTVKHKPPTYKWALKSRISVRADGQPTEHGLCHETLPCAGFVRSLQIQGLGKGLKESALVGE
jgi:hypothetical protein